MSFRGRLTLAAAGAVALAVLIASVGVYFVVRAQLRNEVDASLRQRVELIQSLPADFKVPSASALPNGVPRLPAVPPASLGGPSGYLQLVSTSGKATRPGGGSVEVPVTIRTLAVARGEADTFLFDTTIAGTHVRVLTAPLRKGVALQLVRPLDEVDAVMSRLRWILLAVMVGGVAVAAALGAAVSRAALGPVTRLTEAAESVSTTLDLSERIEETGRDEIGRLGASFNRMLGALEGSVSAQRQLVEDASHELRTPLTSLRVNVETLLRGDALASEERGRLRRRRRRAARRDDLADRRGGRGRARRHPASPTRDRRARRGCERGRATAAPRQSCHRDRRDNSAGGRRGRSGAHRAGGCQSARQRLQVESERGDRRGTARRGRASLRS